MKQDMRFSTAHKWLSDLCTRHAAEDALLDRKTGRSMNYTALWQAIACEMAEVRTAVGASGRTWIVEERPDHAVVPYLASLALGRRVCLCTAAGFADAFATLAAPGDERALVYRSDKSADHPGQSRHTIRRSVSLWDQNRDHGVTSAVEILEEAGAGEVVFFSSGTTGRSKAIIIPWAALVGNVEELADAFVFTRERHLLVLPLSHSNGQVLGLLAPIARGGTVVLGERTGIAALFALWRDVAALRIDVVDCVPTAIQSLLTMGQSPEANDHHPRLFITGGATISPTTILAFQSRFGVPLLQEYGLSEGVCVSACERPDARKLGSVGKPLPGTDIRIVRSDGSPAQFGERGRVLIRSHNRTSHYESSGASVAPILDDGFLTTNDIGLVDNEGFLFIFGRSDDTLIKGGLNIVPTDIEAFLAKYPGIANCAVVGFPCATYGQDLVVLYVQGPGSPVVASELKAHLRDQGDRMWYPRAVISVEALPMTSSGKLLRRDLQALLPAAFDGTTISVEPSGRFEEE